MKILYVLEELYKSGGTERIVSFKASWFAQECGFDVTIITFDQSPEQLDFFPLSNKVKRVRLSSSHATDVNKQLLQDLSEFLKENPQDICFSTYGREFGVLPKLKDGSKKIFEFHFAYDINKHWTSNGHGKVYTEFVGWLKTLKMVRTAKKYDRIVVLTKTDKKRWNTDKVVQIYNPHTITVDRLSDCTQKNVVAAGRMDYQKGFDYLIDSWAIVEKAHPDWKLHIYGYGDTVPYENQIKRLGLQNVVLHDSSHNMADVYQNSSIYALSSRYEGFSLTICEAMTCGLPIVTYDCPSGPAELVEDRQNGYIVKKVGDVDEFADKIKLLIENENERKVMGACSKRKSESYSVDKIMSQWLKLFSTLK